MITYDRLDCSKEMNNILIASYMGLRLMRHLLEREEKQTYFFRFCLYITMIYRVHYFRAFH